MTEDLHETLDVAAGEAVGAASEEASAAGSPALDPELAEKLMALRQRTQSAFAQAVTALMQTPRYRHQSLADLNHLILKPLIKDRLAIATAKAGADPQAFVGMVLWASVSDEVDAKIREQAKAGVFPTRLNAGDWASGDTLWLLDVIAPSRELASAVLTTFGQIARDRPVQIHPMAARVVDPKLLERLKSKPADGSQGYSDTQDPASETALQ